MKKAELMSRLTAVFADINDMCDKGRMKPIRIKEDAELTIQGIKEIFDWYNTTVAPSMAEAKYVRGLCKEQVWTNYALMGGCNNLREVKMMNIAFNNLAKALREQGRPSTLERYKTDLALTGQKAPEQMT